MLIDEVIRTCAVGPVAEAAVVSVGGLFAQDVRKAAAASGVSVGDYAVTSIARFAHRAYEADMRALASVMATSEVPVLAGVECILTRGMGEG